MSVWERIKEAVGTSNTYGTKIPTGVLVSLSGPGKKLVYDDDVASAMQLLVDKTIDFGKYSLDMNTVERPSSRAQYYRIVPDSIVERVCEVRVREADT